MVEESRFKNAAVNEIGVHEFKLNYLQISKSLLRQTFYEMCIQTESTNNKQHKEIESSTEIYNRPKPPKSITRVHAIEI